MVYSIDKQVILEAASLIEETKKVGTQFEKGKTTGSYYDRSALAKDIVKLRQARDISRNSAKQNEIRLQKNPNSSITKEARDSATKQANAFDNHARVLSNSKTVDDALFKNAHYNSTGPSQKAMEEQPRLYQSAKK